MIRIAGRNPTRTALPLAALAFALVAAPSPGQAQEAAAPPPAPRTLHPDEAGVPRTVGERGPLGDAARLARGPRPVLGATAPVRVAGPRVTGIRVAGSQPVRLSGRATGKLRPLPAVSDRGPGLETALLAVGAVLVGGALADYAGDAPRPGLTAAQAGAFGAGAVLVGWSALRLGGGERVIAGR